MSHSPNPVGQYLSGLITALNQLAPEPIEQAIERIHQARLAEQTIFTLGNGGSASTATHFAADLGKNSRVPGWPPVRVIGLADNMAVFSAYANDEGYESVFATQLASLGRPGDLVIAISASGNSANVLRAVELARQNGLTAIGLTGFSGGRLAALVDIHIHVASDCIEQVEDAHVVIMHLIIKTIRERAMAAPPNGLADDALSLLA
jgi:D-sedoheptulose 7-phosphate isomerase